MKALTSQQREIAEKNHGLVISFIRKNHLDFNEYYGDLAETYCLTIASYDKSKGKLSTYVFVSLGNKIKNIYRERTSTKTFPNGLLYSLDEPVSLKEGACTFSELIPDRETDIERGVCFRMAWEQANKELSTFELAVLDNIIYREQSQRILAKKYNISQTSYVRREKAVKEKARQIFTDAVN
ncbi:MAG: hypothetical protein LBI03_03025 [Clostridiales bacterium]|jgi:RNA polymerase sigma factor (sigma-70 family)|nr:hypothetical protein [Clostridiales bacterium]